jgi:hypothetical protein
MTENPTYREIKEVIACIVAERQIAFLLVVYKSLRYLGIKPESIENIEKMCLIYYYRRSNPTEAAVEIAEKIYGPNLQGIGATHMMLLRYKALIEKAKLKEYDKWLLSERDYQIIPRGPTFRLSGAGSLGPFG